MGFGGYAFHAPPGRCLKRRTVDSFLIKPATNHPVSHPNLSHTVLPSPPSPNRPPCYNKSKRSQSPLHCRSILYPYDSPLTWLLQGIHSN